MKLVIWCFFLYIYICIYISIRRYLHTHNILIYSMCVYLVEHVFLDTHWPTKLEKIGPSFCVYPSMSGSIILARTYIFGVISCIFPNSKCSAAPLHLATPGPSVTDDMLESSSLAHRWLCCDQCDAWTKFWDGCLDVPDSFYHNGHNRTGDYPRLQRLRSCEKW